MLSECLFALKINWNLVLGFYPQITARLHKALSPLLGRLMEQFVVPFKHPSESFCQMLCLKISGGLLFLLDSVDKFDSSDHVRKTLWQVQPAPTLLSATG